MEEKKEGSDRLLIVFIVVLLVGLLIAGASILFLMFGDSESPAPAEPTPIVITQPPVEPPIEIPGENPAPVPTVVIPLPEPEEPTGEVIAPDGVYIRSGPSTVYAAVGTAPLGTKGEIIGRSQDGAWWVFDVPGAANNQGWAARDFIAATNADAVSVIPAPALPTATSLPAVSIEFWADSTAIAQGQCTILRWKTANIKAVWVYPQGQPYQNHPTVGESSHQVCPPQTTTYEMRVERTDGAIEMRQVTISVAVSNPLANTSWKVATLRVNEIPIEGTSLTAVFGGDGKINVGGGCNTFNGVYAVGANSGIAIDDLAGTQEACEETVMNQENIYMNALDSAALYELTGNQLILRDGVGQELVRFDRSG